LSDGITVAGEHRHYVRDFEMLASSPKLPPHPGEEQALITKMLFSEITTSYYRPIVAPWQVAEESQNWL